MAFSYTVYRMHDGRWGYALYDAGVLAPFITGGDYAHASSARRVARRQIAPPFNPTRDTASAGSEKPGGVATRPDTPRRLGVAITFKTVP